MTDHTTPSAPGDTSGTVTSTADETIALRTKAFVALALGTVGALGGGIVGTALQWAIVELFGRGTSYENLFLVLQGLVPAALGAAAVVLGGAAGRDPEPVATPVGRTAVLLGAIAIVGGLTIAAIALIEG